MREKFSEYFDVISGYAFKSADLQEEGDIPVIKIGNISNGGDIIEDNSTQYVTSDFMSVNEKYHVDKGDVLISLTGSHINQPNSMVGRTCRNYCNKKFLLNQRAGKIIPKKNVSLDYVYYLLSSRSIQESIVTRAYGAANQVNVSPSAIGSIKWEFPKIDEQREIGEALSYFDELIMKNNKRINILEQMAENLYKEWFVRFRFPGYENAEFENGIPKGWKLYRIDDLCRINSRTIKNNSGIDEIAYLDTGSLNNNIIDLLETYQLQEAPSRAKRLVKKDSILFSTVRPALKHYGILKKVNDNMVVSTGFAVIDAKEKISNVIYMFLSSNAVVEYCQTVAEGAVATYPSIKPEEIGKIKILMAPMDLVQELNKKLEDIFLLRTKLIEKNSNLMEQRDLLLPRLMSGKLQVK